MPTGAEALDEPFSAFSSWFLRITCDRCGKDRMISERHTPQRDMAIRDILDRMRHDGCGGGRAGKAELLTGLEGVSSRPIRKIVGTNQAGRPAAERADGVGIAVDVAPSQIGAMPYHRFKVGQTVVAPSGGRDLLIPRGPLVVVRLLPLADGEPQYRVRSELDGLDRVVLERQIRLVEKERSAPPAEPLREHPTKPRR